MLIWQSHVNANMQPAADRAAEVAACIGPSWWGCWEVMGPVVKRPPQTGPKQPAGGIEEAPCCTDWPDSSDSSGEDRLSAGRWEEGYLCSRSGSPPLLLTSPLTLSLPISLHVFAVSLSYCLASPPGPRRCLKKLCLNLNGCQGFVHPSLMLPWPVRLLLLLFHSSKNNKLTWRILYVELCWKSPLIYSISNK